MPSIYFVRRKGRVKGPLTREKILALQQEDRLRMRDEIGQSEDGPWQRLIDVYDEIFGEDSASFATDTPQDEEFWAEDSAAANDTPRPATRQRMKDGGKRKAATAEKTGRKPDGLFGTRVKPWQVIAAISGGLGVVGLAVFAAMVWAPLTEAPSDPSEIAANINIENPGPVRKPKPRPKVAATKEAAAPEPLVAATPQAIAPPAPADPPPASEPATPAAEPATTNGLSETPADPVEAIKALLTAYYSAGDWQTRYRLVRQDEKAKALVRRLYEDVDWLSVEWRVTKMPAATELATAAASGEPVRIDTLTNGNPHSIYVVFVDGRWQIDWLESLETLWLTR